MTVIAYRIGSVYYCVSCQETYYDLAQAELDQVVTDKTPPTQLRHTFWLGGCARCGREFTVDAGPTTAEHWRESEEDGDA